MTQNITPLIKIAARPFFTGPLQMNEGYDYPATLPFDMGVHPQYVVPRLIMSDEIRKALDKAYSSGSMASTPLGESSLATVRMNEVLENLLSSFKGDLKNRKFLEVGCGNGELLNQLKLRGANVTGLEIGPQAKVVEERYGIRMLTEPLSVGSLDEKFDCIFSYGCLEHIENLEDFFVASRDCLNPNGLFFHSVPNSDLSFRRVDLYHLLHEHINYFTPANGVDLLNCQGFCKADAQVTISGNELMIWGYFDPAAIIHWPVDKFMSEVKIVEEYGRALTAKSERTLAALKDKIARGNNIGFYAGGYEYGYFLHEPRVRYFDGDEFKHGRKWLKDLPAIEPPKSLVDTPVDELIICKPHYFDAIRRSLIAIGVDEKSLVNIESLNTP